MSLVVNKSNKYGYRIMESSYPHDIERWTEETYEDAVRIVGIISRHEPKAKLYICEITEHEVYQAALNAAAMV